MAVYCFKCPACGVVQDRTEPPTGLSYCSETGKNVRLVRDYKAEQASFARSSCRAVDRG